MKEKIIIDASNSVLGRLASFAAKQALLGRQVIILNCNNVLITGRKETIINDYRILFSKGGSSLKGPKIPKVPERIMKRTIRGMLSHKQWRGKKGLKRILCYNSVPEEYQNEEKISLSKKLKIKTITLQELVRNI